MNTLPRLTVGLPVYNGEEHLAESFEALLGQTYGDFLLLVSDNASTDGTEEICRGYAAQDPRITYVRQPRNIGAHPNHQMLLDRAHTEFFKWASHDDLYARDLLRSCVEALDANPRAVLAHSAGAIIDGAGRVTHTVDYRLRTTSDVPSERYRSQLFEPGGDDIYGIARTAVLRSLTPLDSYHHADRTWVAELTLFGPFVQVPEILYFRRDHPTRAERAHPSRSARCTNLDPRRAGHSDLRLLAGCARGFVHGIAHAPLSSAERRRCNRALAEWAVVRMRPRPGATLWRPVGDEATAELAARTVAGAERRPRVPGHVEPCTSFAR